MIDGMLREIPPPRPPRLPRGLTPIDEVLDPDEQRIDGALVTSPLPEIAEGAWFTGCRFEPLAVHGCEAPRVALHDCDLTGIDGVDVRLDSLNLRRVALRGSRLRATQLADASIEDLAVVDCTLSMSSIRMSRIKRAAFTECTFEELDFIETRFTDCTFERCTFREVDFSKANLTGCRLADCSWERIKGATGLAGARIPAADLIELGHSLATELGIVVEAGVG